MNPILECRGLTKNYNNFTALSNLNLTLDKGQIIGLLGPNGSGKTTLIKLINGLLVPTDGRILINGLEPSVATRNIVSYLPERTYLSDWMKVKEIVSYFKDFYTNFNESRAYEMLTHLQISPNARLRTLSKGTKEKVQLILVMSRDADLYVLDEPIGGVDPAARDYILSTILTNYNENATILISTHLITDIENILDRVLFLQNGHIALNASVDDIRMEHGKSVDTLFREVFNVKQISKTRIQSCFPRFASASHFIINRMCIRKIYVSGICHDGTSKCDCHHLTCVFYLHPNSCAMCHNHFNCCEIL